MTRLDHDDLGPVTRDPERRAAIEAEVARLTGATPEPAADDQPTLDPEAAGA